MNAIILSAGKGTRLKTLTSKLPKPMIRIKGKPILQHNIELCKKAGINNILINLHYLPETVKKYFNDGSDFGVKIIYNYEKELLNTAGALIPFIKIIKDEPLFVIYGDNYISIDLLELKKFHDIKKSDFSVLLSRRNKVKHSGVVNLNYQQRIVKFIEKPNLPDTHYRWVNAGIYYFNPQKILDFISPNDDFGNDVFPKLIRNNVKIFGLKTSEKLVTIDTPSMFKEAINN